MIALDLQGTPYERGLQQAAVDPALRDAAQSHLSLRLERVRKTLGTQANLDFARDLQAHAKTRAADAMTELQGIADGYGLSAFDLFCIWHAAVLGEAHAAREGCAAVAIGDRRTATLLKNRDVPAETQRIQTVFRIFNPARGGTILGVSSLGSSPCASSGLNEAGLCIADTHVATRDHGVGLVRYIVMQQLLAECRDVAEATEMLRAVIHAGGGTLAMADAGGNVAIAELGHRRIHIEAGANVTLGRTNHFIGAALSGDNLDPADSPAGANSRARFAAIVAALESRNGHPPASDIAALLSSHGDPDPLCRHGTGIDQPRTISRTLYEPDLRRLTITDGVPCSSPSLTFTIERRTLQELAS